MVDRIRELLIARQFTPTQFADLIGVARPIISHILSGRNKPSLEVVQKIVDALPDISLTWLLKGVGSMEATEPTPLPSQSSLVPPAVKRSASKVPETAHHASAKEERHAEAVAHGPAPTAVVSEVNAAITAVPAQDLVPPLPLFTVPDTAATVVTDKSVAGVQGEPAAFTAPIYGADRPALNRATDVPTETSATGIGPESNSTSSSEIPSAAQPLLNVDKAIRRIVIFYRDGTFSDYQPENG